MADASLLPDAPVVAEGTRQDEASIAAPAESQCESIEKDGFAGTGFAGQDSEAGLELHELDRPRIDTGLGHVALLPVHAEVAVEQQEEVTGGVVVGAGVAEESVGSGGSGALVGGGAAAACAVGGAAYFVVRRRRATGASGGPKRCSTQYSLRAARPPLRHAPRSRPRRHLHPLPRSRQRPARFPGTATPTSG